MSNPRVSDKSYPQYNPGSKRHCHACGHAAEHHVMTKGGSPQECCEVECSCRESKRLQADWIALVERMKINPVPPRVDGLKRVHFKTRLGLQPFYPAQAVEAVIASLQAELTLPREEDRAEIDRLNAIIAGRP